MTSHLKINELQLVKDHNSYELAEPRNISQRLQQTPVIELDLWAAGNGDWQVAHSIPLTSSYEPPKPFLSQYLSYIKQYHDQNPSHELIWINLDFKTDWLSGSGKGDFETLIRKYFSNSVLYRPKDLKGSYTDVRSAARAGAWPVASSLRGRVIVVMTGGAVWRHNQHQSSYIKDKIINNNYEGVAFVAPVADDWDDVNQWSGDLDGINNEKLHVVMFNGKYGNRAKINTSYVYDQNLLMWFWDVPMDATNFASVVELYKASIVGTQEKPENIRVNAGYTKTGQRGRSMGSSLVTFYEDDNGWTGRGSTFELGIGKYDNKGHYNSKGNPLNKGWNDEVRAVRVPEGLKVYMTDKDSFQSGGKGSVTIIGPKTCNIKDVASNSGLAGKVSSVEITRV